MKSLATVVLGGAAGYAWYRAVGCNSGACPLWSNPYLATVAGSALGWAWLGGGEAKG